MHFYMSFEDDDIFICIQILLQAVLVDSSL